MESFYSLIYYKTNTLTDELINIGMIGGGGEGPFMFLSTQRMDFLKKLLHANTFLSVKRRLHGLKTKVDTYREDNPGSLLFDTVFSIEQLTALSEQSKGAILYSQPTIINEWMDASFFNLLVAQFYGSNQLKKKRKRLVFHLKWKAFYQSKKFENWQRDITIHALKEDTPLTLSLDLVNLEKKEIYKGFNFDLSAARLNQKLYEVELITNALTDYTLILVHPAPKSVKGKEQLGEMETQFPTVQKMSFSAFKKTE